MLMRPYSNTIRSLRAIGCWLLDYWLLDIIFLHLPQFLNVFNPHPSLNTLHELDEDHSISRDGLLTFLNFLVRRAGLTSALQAEHRSAVTFIWHLIFQNNK